MSSKIRLVADNLQITNPVVAKALKEMDPGPIREMVSDLVKAGAEAIDINTGPLTRNGEEKMTFLVDSVQSACDAILILDTTNATALEAGLKASRRKTIINGFSLQPEKLETILPLAKKYDTDIIGYLLYPNGHVPQNELERMNVALDLYMEFQKTGLDPCRLIIDPIIPPLLWENGNRQAMEILAVFKNLPDLLGLELRTMAGLSNLTTGKGPKDKKLLLEEAYACMLAAEGLNLALVNIFHTRTVRLLKACNALKSSLLFTWEDAI